MRVVTGEEMRQIDRFTIEQIGLGEEVLMENAGKAVFDQIRSSLQTTDQIAVLIGAGNNGGDGFVIARYLKESGYQVDVWLVPEQGKVRGTAKYHMDVYRSFDYDFFPYDSTFHQKIPNYSVIIDCLLGTGISGKVRSPYDRIISAINEQNGARIIAVDLPSGLNADGANEDTIAVMATETITLQCPKLSAFMYPARHYYGKLTTVSIGIPQKAVEKHGGMRFLWTKDDAKRTLPRRIVNGHKGTFGKALVIAGSQEMTGAAVMAVSSCHKAGAGLVTVAIPDCIQPIVASHVITATFLPCASQDGYFSSENDRLFSDLSLYDAVAIGPGLGRKEHLSSVVEKVLQETKGPLIIDADGLYHLKNVLPQLQKRQYPTILTPHHGEMARLVDCSVKEVEENRFELAKQFALEYHVYLVLKGPYTIVATPEGHLYINTTGNVALAKGGSGDVLTGIMLAQVMQGKNLQESISNSVFIHGLAADLLVQEQASMYDVVATDLIEALPLVFRSLICS